MEELSKPLTLKCGLTLPNRLVKAAMAEQMADGRNLPQDRFHRAYSKWADGGWGMIQTGRTPTPPVSYINICPDMIRKRLRRPGLPWYAP